jgi:hypothetical protein
MFLNDLVVKVVDGGYMLTEPLEYQDGQKIYVVPAGFVTNFASIPRPARILITGHGRERLAATLHDYLYFTKYDRRHADKLFLKAMESSGVNWFLRHAMHKAVRVGGWAFH